MPWVELACVNCEQVSDPILEREELNGLTSGKEKEISFCCPFCGKNKFRKLFSVPGTAKGNWAKWQEGLKSHTTK